MLFRSEEIARVDVGETIGAQPLLQGLLLPLFGITLDDSSVGVNDMRGHGDPFRLLRDVEEDSFIVLPLEYLRRPVTVRGGSVDITGDIFKGTGRSDTVIDVEEADRLSLFRSYEIRVFDINDNVRTVDSLEDVTGYVYRTAADGDRASQVFQRKHDERVFFDISRIVRSEERRVGRV